MDRKPMASPLSFLLLLTLALSAPLQLAAQVPVDESGAPLSALNDEGYTGEALQDIPPLTTAELEELVGPVALYPDDLLAIVLPASTYPLEIVQAARFLDEFETDSSLEPDESWDESVVALLNYPEVIRMLDREIDWTWRLGEAVISQQTDLIAAVESFRDRAYAAGNLESDERQTVSNDDGFIEIDPVDDEIIYVPYYEPEEVVVYQSRRVYHYYPQAYPVYYYPYPYGHSFASGYFWGVTTAFTIGWSNHYLHVYHPSYSGHPYYGHHYYGHYYRHSSISVYNHWYVHNSYRSSSHHYRDGDQWRPRHRSGARPATRSVRNYQYPSGTRNDYRARTGSNVDSRSAIRFRDRVDGDSVRTDRGDNSRRSSSSDRQRLTARNSRQSNSDTRATRTRLGSQRSVPVRQVSTRTSSRSGASQRPASQRSVQRQTPVQRQNTRATVQRQVPVQRQAARAPVQRQAPAPRQTARAPVQRQAPARQAAPSANQVQPVARTQRQAPSSRSIARTRRPH